MKKKCKFCGKQFETNNHKKAYCNTSHREMASKKKHQQTCTICGKRFRTPYKKKTCSPECNVKLRHQSAASSEADESLCFTCARAYAKPFELGGCDKFLYGKVCYNHAIFHKCDNTRGDFYVIIQVIDCNLYVRGRKIED